MKNAIRWCLIMVLFCVTGPRLGNGAEHKRSVIAPTDRSALIAASGKDVEVTGVVSHVGVSKSKFFTFITFEGVPAGGFTAVVKSSDLASVERTVGSNLEAGLPGRKVSVRGVISFYKESPQIEITEGSQLIIQP